MRAGHPAPLLPSEADFAVGETATEMHRDSTLQDRAFILVQTSAQYLLCGTRQELHSLLCVLRWFFGETFPERMLVSVNVRVLFVVSSPGYVESG